MISLLASEVDKKDGAIPDHRGEQTNTDRETQRHNKKVKSKNRR